MTAQTEPVFHPRAARMNLPGIHGIEILRPLRWLADGARDFRIAWVTSLFYGVLFAVAGHVLTDWASGRPHLAMALISGFIFIAPVLATVFYCTSHRIEHHHRLPGLIAPLFAWRMNPASMGLFALMLVFILSAWERLSAILVGLFLNGAGIGGLGELLTLDALSRHPDFFVVYLAFGGVLALAVFALTVVSLPMILHRRVDLATALVTSVMAFRHNILPMLVWAAIIAGLIAVGFATQFVAMAVVFPLLGHASWHAYRELVERE